MTIPFPPSFWNAGGNNIQPFLILQTYRYSATPYKLENMSRLYIFLSCIILPLAALSYPAGTMLMTPNLKISGSPSLTVNGLVIQASLTVINNGNGPAGASNLRFYISTDQSISDSDYWLGMQTLPPLAAGETTHGTLNVDICNMGLPPGTYYLGYCIDADKQVAETSESDNWGALNASNVVVGGMGAYTKTGIGGSAACDNLIETFLANWKIPGATVAIARKGKMIYERGFGYADCHKTETVKPYHRFRIASLSKPITAVAIMKLIENGQLSLSSKVFGAGGILNADPYFANANINDSRVYQITVRHLLEHTAGWNRAIPCLPTPAAPYPWGIVHCDAFSFPLTVTQQLNEPNPVSRKALIKFLLEDGLQFSPGASYQYSNIGYSILGQIIEQITGTNYEQWVQQNIFAPAGICGEMEIGKTLLSEKLPREAEYFSPYKTLSAFGDGTLAPWQYGGFYTPSMDSHGGWIANAADLLRFLLAVDKFSTKPDILQSSTITTMTTPSSQNQYYAKGWSVNAVNNWWHTGALDGTATFFVRSNDEWTWAILLNKRHDNNQFWIDLDQLPWNCFPQLPSGTPAYDLLAQPTAAASGLNAVIASATSITLAWTNGSGNNRLVLAREGAPVDQTPLNGTIYAASTNFGQGADLGNGNFVVYAGSGNSVTVNNLNAGKRYYFQVVEYNLGANTNNKALYRYCDAPETDLLLLPAPVAGFTATPASGAAPLAVTFTDNSQNNPTGWQWQFPGGSPNSYAGQQPPVVTYQTPGNYTAILTASNAGGSSTATKTIQVNVPAPVAGFSASPVSGCATLTVAFTNESSAWATNFSWQFPGGTPSSSSLPDPVVQYSSAGMYNVSLTATNVSGSDTEVKNNLITVTDLPVAGYTAQTAPLSATFTNQSSGGNSYLWEFSGGTPANFSGANPPVVSYPAPGQYVVKLTATNSCGSATHTVSVNVPPPAPVANFTVAPASGNAPLAVTFTDQSSNFPSSWQWQFPGGSPAAYSGKTPPAINYNTPGTYTATLTVSNSTGSHAVSKTVQVTQGAPVTNFSADNTCGSAPFTVHFTDNSANSPTAWQWQFPGGTPSNSTAQNPVVIYASAGTYPVTLTTSNAGGSHLLAKTGYIRVMDLDLAASPGFEVCAGTSVNLTATGADGYTWTGPGLNGVTGSSVQITPLTSGTYTLTGNKGPGCISVPYAFTLSVKPVPAVVVNVSDPELCAGDSLTMTASGASTYSWSGPNLHINTGPVVTTGTLPPGAYSYTVTGETAGCTSQPQNVTVQVWALPAVNVDVISSTLCVGDTLLFLMSGATNYYWSGPGFLNDTGSVGTLVLQAPGLTAYGIAWSDDRGCGEAVQFELDISEVPVILAYPSSFAVCLGDTLQLFASGADTYEWAGPGILTNSGSETIVVPPTTGILNYTVTGISVAGCSASGSFAVQINEPLTLGVQVDITGCPGPNLLYTANVTNGGAFPDIIWYINGIPAGNGESFVYDNAKNGDLVWCVVQATNPPECLDQTTIQSSVFEVNCIPVVNVRPDISDVLPLKLYPNPNSGVFTLQTSAPHSGLAGLLVLDVLGRPVHRIMLQAAAGYNTWEIRLPGLPAGIYYLAFSMEGKRGGSRFRVGH